MRHCSFAIIGTLLLLVVVTACGDTAEAPTSRPDTPVPAESSISRTATSAGPTPTSADAAIASPEAGSNYELVARWGEPVPVLVPSGVAVLPDGSVAVADIEGSRIVVFDPGGELAATWTSEGIWSLAAGPDGQLYALRSRGGPPILVYDRDGALLRQIEIPFATADSRANVTGMTVASDGSIFVTSGLEAGTGMSPAPFSGVLMLGPTGGELARWPAPDGLQPQHIAVSDDGMVSVALTPARLQPTAPSPGQFPAILVRFDAETGPSEDWLEAELPLSDEIQIDALTVAPDGSLLAVDAAGINPDEPETTRVYAIDPETGEVAEIAALDERRGAQLVVSGMATNDAGEIYLTDAVNHRVLRLSADGEVIGELGGVQPDQLGVPLGVDLGPDGRLFVHDPATARVVMFDDDGTNVATWDVPRNYPYALGARSDIAVGDDGTIVVTDDAPGQAIVLSPDGEVIDEWMPPMNANAQEGEPQIFQPDRIALFEERLYVTIVQEPIIASYSLDGELLDTWPVEVSEALDVDATSDALYALVTVPGDDGAGSPATARGERDVQVQRLVGDEVEVVASISLGNVQEERPDFFPVHFTVAPDGAIFLADPFDREIVKLDAEGNEVARWQLGEDISPSRGSWLSLAADDTRLYVADAAARQVLVFEATE